MVHIAHYVDERLVTGLQVGNVLARIEQAQQRYDDREVDLEIA